MKPLLRLLAALCLLSLATPAHARDVGTWEMFSLDARSEPQSRWILHTDLHARRMEGRFQALLRPGLGFEVLPGLTLWGGYTWVPVHTDGNQDHSQQDVWQQVQYGHRYGPVNVLLRERLEERFDETVDGVSLRLRGMARLGYVLHPALELALWDEAFVDLNETDWASKGFQENRAFFGPAWHFNQARMEVGYMNQFVHSSQTMAHVVMTALFLNY